MGELNNGVFMMIGVVISLVGMAIAIYRSIGTGDENVRKELYEKITDVEDGIERARSTERGGFQAMLSRLENDLERLKRETVRREELQQLETRLTQQVGKIEAQIGRIGDRLSALAVLEATSKQNADRLDRLVALMESRQHTVRPGAHS